MDPDSDPDADPHPSIFVSDLQVANKKFDKSFPAYYFLKVHLHHFSKIKSQKEVTKKAVGIKVFLTSIFAW
jgi:hypothetical protein